MATKFSSTLKSDVTADAGMIAFAQFIDDLLLVTGGWTLSSDTGQTAPAALHHPTSGNQSMGYRIYKMADALQASAPLFMRIDYASSQILVEPAIWVTLGQSSDGAGNITNVLLPATVVMGGNSTGVQSSAANSYGSAAPNRCCFALFINNTAMNYPFVFGIERTKDASGADTNAGWLVVFRSTASASQGLDRSRYVVNALGAQPAIETGLSYALTSKNPSETLGGDIGLGVVILFKGVAQQPGVNFMITNSNDVGVEGSLTMSIYGTNVTYVQLNNLTPWMAVAASATGVNDTNGRCLMRYD